MDEYEAVVRELTGSFCKHITGVSKKYCWSTNDYDFGHDLFDTREKALQDAVESEETDFYTAIAVPTEFFPCVDVDYMIELIINDARNDGGDYAEYYLLDLDQKIVEELETALNQALTAWINKHNLQPTWFKVVDVKRHQMEEEPWKTK